jgi:molybdopterin-guanine dinucleotide biosynthesis protein A
VTTLGAILAGGRSTRFGSDKAVAMLRGRPLIEHVRQALARQCDEVGVVGREGGLADRPQRGMGPLGGLAGALHHAAEQGHERVLSCGVDSVDLPADLVDLLSPAPSHVASQPVIGLWPVSAAPALDRLLASDSRHSMRAFAEAIGARAVKTPFQPANVNTREDLARLEQHHGL